MALTKSLTLTDNFNEPVNFTAAYIKVFQVNSTKETCIATYRIMTDGDGQILQEHFTSFPLNLEGSNPIKQAYLHLKTLPEFANAVDC